MPTSPDPSVTRREGGGEVGGTRHPGGVGAGSIEDATHQQLGAGFHHKAERRGPLFSDEGGSRAGGGGSLAQSMMRLVGREPALVLALLLVLLLMLALVVSVAYLGAGVWAAVDAIKRLPAPQEALL